MDLKQFQIMFVILLIAVRCSTPSPETYISQNEFRDQLRKSYVRVDGYDGFDNTFVAEFTFLRPDLVKSQVRKTASQFFWGEPKMLSVQNERVSKARSEVKAFLSFYTPNAKDDDLFRPNSVWRIVLRTQGNDLEGKVNKVNKRLTELKANFPHHSRFHSAYDVSFGIPWSDLGSDAEIIVTGRLGTGRSKLSELH